MLWLVNSRHADQIMICTGTQLLKNTKPNFLMLSQKNQSKCSTFFTREMYWFGNSFVETCFNNLKSSVIIVREIN